MSKPVPKPRRVNPAVPGDVPTTVDNTPTYPVKTPPPVAPKPKWNVRVGGQPLPDMVPFISPTVQPSGEEQHHIEKGIDMMAVNATKPKTWQYTSESPDQSDIKMMTLQSLIKMINQRLLEEKMEKPSPFTPAAEKGPGYKAITIPDTEDNEDLMKWWRAAEPWEKAPKACGLPDYKAAEIFTEKALCVKKALRLYDLLLSEREGTLCALIGGLLEVADNLNKVHKGVKIAGITGGAAGAAGVAAAVGGILLAPLTLGASLAVTAVGVGVAAAGGVTGASAAITNKVNTSIDRKKVEKILQDYTTEIEDIENCVAFISSGIEYLNSYNLSKLHGVDQEAAKMAKVAKKAGRITVAISANSKSSGLIQGFALGMDIHFTKDDKQKLKKGSETKFAKQIREVAQNMAASLDKLMKVKNDLKSVDV